MAEPVLRITHGDYSFDLRGLTAKEMAKVKAETGFANRREFFDAITDEDPNAIIAAFVLARTRNDEKVRWDDIDVDLDEVRAAYYDSTDREVEPVFETNDDGSMLLVKWTDDGRAVKDEAGKYIPDPNGEPIGKRDKHGRLIWRYVDTGEEVPPTGSAETTTSSPATTSTPGDSLDSVSGIPEMSLS